MKEIIVKPGRRVGTVLLVVLVGIFYTNVDMVSGYLCCLPDNC
ncbi:MAG: hypothetical protein DDT19_02057 [Syntrophomonadaceae bacterium]|nr:hypothetical protein [Bacillota bacterium]